MSSNFLNAIAPLAVNFVPGVGDSFLGQFATDMYFGGADRIKNSFSGKAMSRTPNSTKFDINPEKFQNNMNNTLNKIGSFIKKGSYNMIKVSAADVNFVNDLVHHLNNRTINSTHTKTAGFGGVLSDMLDSPILQKGVPLLNAIALGSLGISGAGLVYDKVKDAVKKEMAYHEMFNEFPELNEMPRSQVDKYWGVLSDFAPKLTTNPLVAGQFISNMNSYGMKGIDHNTVGQLAQMNKNLEDDHNQMLKTLGSLGVKGFEETYNSLLHKEPVVADLLSDI